VHHLARQQHLWFDADDLLQREQDQRHHTWRRVGNPNDAQLLDQPVFQYVHYAVAFSKERAVCVSSQLLGSRQANIADGGAVHDVPALTHERMQHAV